MRSIIRRIEEIDGLSSYSNFVLAIRGRNFSRQSIARNFNKVVEKDDYQKSDKRAIISHLHKLSKSS